MKRKSFHIIFNLRKGICPSVHINQFIIAHSENIKYLDITFDSQINWKAHIKNKRTKEEFKNKIIYCFIGRNFQMLPENKFI